MKHTSDSALALAEEVRVFLRKGAHDVQNLFHMINMWITTDYHTDEAQVRQLLDAMQQQYTQEIARLQQSFDEYLSIRADTADIAPVCVLMLTNQIVDEIRTQWPDLTIEVDCTADATVVHYPEKQLSGAIRALLDNAQRYRQPTRAPHIKVRVQLVGGSVAVSVQDNGIGIDTDHYGDQLFAPFVRCTHQSEGQGIRLHLIKVMVAQYGGDIRLESQPEVGTTATLSLPRHT